MQNQEVGSSELLLNKNCLDEKTELFIETASRIHNNAYDYTKVKYVNSATKVEIVCPFHGSFFQTPNKHISAKTGCPICSREKIKNNKEKIKIKNFTAWKNQTETLFPNYSYFADYENCKLTVICKIHGTTEHKYVAGNKNQYPCRKCGIIERSKKLLKTNIEYINQARSIHGGVYEYTEENNEIYAICKKHGIFLLSGNRKQNHINRQSGCPECKSDFFRKQYSKNHEDFFKQANSIHKNKYSYSNVKYINTHTKIEITCPVHGSFFQTPLNHLQGAGCPRCKSSKGEQLCREILSKNNIEFEEQKTFENCINPKTGKKLKFDFFLPMFNILLEIDGIHHFQPTIFGKNDNAHEAFVDVLFRDKIKNEFANQNNLLLFRIPYVDVKNINPLINEIINNLKF